MSHRFSKTQCFHTGLHPMKTMMAATHPGISLGTWRADCRTERVWQSVCQLVCHFACRYFGCPSQLSQPSEQSNICCKQTTRVHKYRATVHFRSHPNTLLRLPGGDSGGDSTGDSSPALTEIKIKSRGCFIRVTNDGKSPMKREAAGVECSGDTVVDIICVPVVW